MAQCECRRAPKASVRPQKRLCDNPTRIHTAGVTEELKWGKPCFTCQKKNVAVVIPLKDACALSFFKGALLKDPKHILQNLGEHTEAARWIKFTSLKEVSALQPTLRNYIYEAVRVEDSGKKVLLKKASEYVVPEELQPG